MNFRNIYPTVDVLENRRKEEDYTMSYACRSSSFLWHYLVGSELIPRGPG
jgi:hypothetical protein